VARRPPGLSIAVVGTVATDLVGRAARLAGPDEAATVTELAIAPGGCAGNVAAGLARLGERPTLVSAVGPDFRQTPYGRALRTAGVDLAGLVLSRRPTATSILLTDPRGRQSIYYAPGAMADLRLAVPPRADVAHFAAGELRAYPRLMRGSDLVTFDPGQETFQRPLDEVAACLARADVLFANRFELARLRKGLRLDVRDLLDSGLSVVVETRGKEGSVVHADGARVAVPAVPARAVDPTGAGDAHRSGFLYGLLRDWPLVECAKMGAVTASFAVARVGAQAGLPTERQALARFRQVFGRLPT